ARVVQFVLSDPVLALPTGDLRRMRSMMPSRKACSITRTRTAMLFFTVDRLHSSAIHPCTARSTAPLVIIRTGRGAMVGTTRRRQPARYGSGPNTSSGQGDGHHPGQAGQQCGGYLVEEVGEEAGAADAAKASPRVRSMPRVVNVRRANGLQTRPR